VKRNGNKEKSSDEKKGSKEARKEEKEINPPHTHPNEGRGRNSPAAFF